MDAQLRRGLQAREKLMQSSVPSGDAAEELAIEKIDYILHLGPDGRHADPSAVAGLPQETNSLSHSLTRAPHYERVAPSCTRYIECSNGTAGKASDPLRRSISLSHRNRQKVRKAQRELDREFVASAG